MKKSDALMLENETLRARLLKMSEVSRRVTESLDLETVLQEIVDGALSLTGSSIRGARCFDESGQVQGFINSGITPEGRSLLGDCPDVWGSSAI